MATDPCPIHEGSLLAAKLGTTKASRSKRTMRRTAGPVKISRPDGSVEWRAPYNAFELNAVLGQGHNRPAGTPLNGREQAIQRRA